MKFLKYALLTLILAIVTDVAFIYAAQPQVVISYALDKNAVQKTSYRTKDTWTAQYYENLETYTWLTNPCPNCKISAKPEDIDGNLYVGIVTSAGQKKQFTDPTTISSPNDYRLNIWRLDTTLLTTYHTAIWYIN